MKNSLLKYLLALTAGFLMVSCQNQERIFPDFAYTTSYFPYKYPIRTLVLGDYVFDNTKDNELKFVISATMGGVYENKEDRFVQFVIDDSLTSHMYVGDTKLKPLPRNFYTLSHDSEIMIPKGKLSGGVEVTLSKEFLADKDAVGYWGTKYVIPLRIVNASTDSVLVGKSAIDNPDPRINTDWDLVPWNFTLFGINYVNQYHGNYLLRGATKITSGGITIENTEYRDKYVEKDEVVAINTFSENEVVYTKRIVRSESSSPGDFSAVITFDESGNATISAADSSQYAVTGKAKFVKDAELWGGNKHHAIYLEYQVSEGENTHFALDTLVFRDKGVSFQEYLPVFK